MTSDDTPEAAPKSPGAPTAPKASGASVAPAPEWAPERAKVPGREDKPLPRRFYKEVGLGVTSGGFAILLDGRPVKTPSKGDLGKGDLVLPTEALARAVAEEWASQAKHIQPTTMPLTKLCNTAIDRVRGRETEIADEIVAYAGSDLVCYRADGPRGLVMSQAAAWDPVLAWAETELGARFAPVVGLIHQLQPADSLERIRRALAAFDAFALCALHNMTTLTGSALVPLAHAHGRLDLAEAWAVAHIDEDHQIAEWGTDDEALARRAGRWLDFRAAGRLLAFVRR